jgi:hypothetical protein
MRGTNTTLKAATAAMTAPRAASQKNAITSNATTTSAARMTSAARHPDRTVMSWSMPEPRTQKSEIS